MSQSNNIVSLSESNSANTYEGEELIHSLSNEGSPKHVKKQDRWTILLVLAAAVSTMGSCVPAGYSISVINAPAQIIKQFCNYSIIERYDINLSQTASKTLWSSIVSIFVVGGMIGSLTGSAFADRWGRKKSIIIANLLAVLASICFILSKEVSSVECLLVGRFVIGLSSGLATAVVPMYLTELAPLRLRGATGVMCPLGLTIGVLLGQIMSFESVLGKENTWHYLLALYSLLTLITFLVMPKLPESPKYLAAILKKEDFAIAELVRLRQCREEQLVEELEQLRSDIAAEKQQKRWTSWKVLKDSELRLPLLLLCALQAGQQFSGINAVFYYSTLIFRSGGLTTKQAEFANLGTGCINLFASIMAVYTMNRFGRRRLLLISTCGSVVCLCLLFMSRDLFESKNVEIAAVFWYVMIYGIGLGPIPYFIGTELFKVGPRPVAMAWGSMSNWAANFTVGMFFPFLQSQLGHHSFLIFMFITVALTVFITFYFPETKDRPEREISQMLKYGFKSKIRG